MKKSTQQIAGIFIIFVVAGIAAVVGIGMLLPGLGGTGVVATPTTYTMGFKDYVTSDEIASADITMNWYKKDTTNLDAEEIGDLAWSDFALDEEEDSTFTPAADMVYVAVVTYTGDDGPYDARWFTTNALVGDGDIDLLTLGFNNISMMNSTWGSEMVAYSEQLTTVVSNTTVRDWTILAQALQYDGEQSSIHGFLPTYNFSDANWNTTVIRIGFNATATAAMAAFQSSYNYKEVASGVYLYYEIYGLAFTDTVQLQIRLSAAVTTAAATMTAPGNITWGYGNTDDFTAWTTQS